MYMMFLFFFFKQKTAYEMRISDWSSDVCSSDLARATLSPAPQGTALPVHRRDREIHEPQGRQRRNPPADPGRPRQPARDYPWPQGRADQGNRQQIGRASCRERVCKDVSISVVAVPLKKKQLIERKHTK